MSDTEIPWSIPVHWTWTTIGDVAQVVGGGTPSTSDPANFVDGTIAWITPADLSGYRDKYISHGKRNLTQRGLDNSGARLLPKGAVLYSSRAPIGYVAIASNPVSTNQGFKSFVLQENLEPEFVYYYLQRAKPLVVGLASGTTFQEISGRNAAKIPLIVTPRAEQRQIVEAIESYFTRLDDAVASLERVQRNLKRYRASVLKAAVEGRLVPTEAELARAEGRTYEPASALLERILAERRRRWEEVELAKMKAAVKAPKDNKWKAKYREPVAPDTSDLPDLPEGWCWSTAEALSDETRSITYGVVKLGSTTLGGVRTLRSSNIRNLYCDFGYVKPISKSISNSYQRTVLRGGEVLVTVRGTLGGVVAVPPRCVGFNISREVAMIALTEPLLAPLVATFIASDVLQKWILRRTRGIAYTGINIATLKRLPIPVPPLAEQSRIIEAVEHHLSIGTSIGRTTDASVRRSRSLRQSILKWAFEGRLVDQNPADEPASVLLDRIKAERAVKATRSSNRHSRRATSNRSST